MSASAADNHFSDFVVNYSGREVLYPDFSKLFSVNIFLNN